MQEKITTRLRDFWDAGIRGPDFIWAATGPALEAYSRHAVVKKANASGEVMAVSEFLTHVRRLVVDFVVGRVLSGNGSTEAVSGLDDITTYYLLHRHSFGLLEIPAGNCILYALACGLSDTGLSDRYDILMRTGGQETPEEKEEEAEAEPGAVEEEEEGTGSKVKLKPWNQRHRPTMGYDPAVDSARARQEAVSPRLPGMERPAPSLRQIPLIDQVHRLMHLWKGGDVSEVNGYLDDKGLLRNDLFHQLLQALIELAQVHSEERSLLESLSNHITGRKATPSQRGLYAPGKE
jgi:putative DNA methylase